MRSTILSFVLVAAAAAPAWAQSRESREHTQIIADLRMLQEQQQRLQVTVNQLLEALKTTNANLAAQSGETTKGFANLKAEIDTISASLPQLQSLLQQTRVDMGRVGPEIDALREALRTILKLNAQIVELLTPTNPIGVPAGTTGNPTDPGATTPPATPPVLEKPSQNLPASPNEFLTVAKAAYASADYLTAIDAFQEFLKVAPDHADAPQAQMQIAQSYLQLKEPQKAQAAFRVVTQKYSQAPQVADAFYFMGQTYEMLKDVKNAIAMYKIVTSKYPNTTAAYRATERLTFISK